MTTFKEFVEKNSKLFDLLRCGLEVTIPQLPAPSTTAYRKSASESAKLRNLGNECFVLRQEVEALKRYNESIANAPLGSEELALAFGNRSAVLLKLYKFECCLLDVNRALKGRIPESTKEKLRKRKKECWEKLESVNQFHSVWLRFAGSLVRGLLRPNDISIDESDFFSLDEDPIWHTKFDKNPLLPDLSSKVELAYNSEWGRHWIATDDIAPGEVLGIEHLFSLRTSKEANECYNLCAHCVIYCEALIPCHSCTLQMYCSERCRQEAYDLYHRIECKIIPSLMPSLLPQDRERILLALQMFLIGTRQSSAELIALMNDTNVYDSLEGKRTCVGVPYAGDYLSILNLLWRNDEDTAVLTVDSSEKLKTVIVLLDALQSVDYFENGRNKLPEENSCVISDPQLFAGFLLFHHVSLMETYPTGVNVTFIKEESDSWVENDVRKVACGISSFQSLMNDSCDANTDVINGPKRRQLVFSIRPIKAGEQIFKGYEYHYAAHPGLIGKEFCEKKDFYLTSDKEIIEKVEKIHNWLLNYMEPDQIYQYKEKDLQKAFECSKSIRKYVREPSPTIMLCEIFIKHWMKLKGNCYQIQSKTRAMILDLGI